MYKIGIKIVKYLLLRNDFPSGQQHFETQLERIKADSDRVNEANMNILATNAKYGNKFASMQQLDENITVSQLGKLREPPSAILSRAMNSGQPQGADLSCPAPDVQPVRRYVRPVTSHMSRPQTAAAASSSCQAPAQQ